MKTHVRPGDRGIVALTTVVYSWRGSVHDSLKLKHHGRHAAHPNPDDPFLVVSCVNGHPTDPIHWCVFLKDDAPWMCHVDSIRSVIQLT